MVFDLGGGNDDVFRTLIARANGNNQPSSFGGGNTNMGADGKASGGLDGAIGGAAGLTPVGMGLNAASGIADTVGAALKPHFDYGQQNYSVQDAAQFEGDRAKNIATSATKGIPLVGGLLGGIFGAIAQKIGEKKAEAHAHMILGNRQSKMNDLQDFQMQKVKDNQFLRSSDLYKNILNPADNGGLNNNNMYGQTGF